MREQTREVSHFTLLSIVIVKKNIHSSVEKFLKLSPEELG